LQLRFYTGNRNSEPKTHAGKNTTQGMISATATTGNATETPESTTQTQKKQRFGVI